MRGRSKFYRFVSSSAPVRETVVPRERARAVFLLARAMADEICPAPRGTAGPGVAGMLGSLTRGKRWGLFVCWGSTAYCVASLAKLPAEVHTGAARCVLRSTVPRLRFYGCSCVFYLSGDNSVLRTSSYCHCVAAQVRYRLFYGC